MKRCPYCSERNRSDATTCRYCGQYLAPRPTGAAAGQAVPSAVGQITGSSPWAVAAFASGVITALTFLAVALARPYLPRSYDQVFVLAVPYFLVWWLLLGVVITVARKLKLTVRKMATQIVWIIVAIIYILAEQIPDLLKGKEPAEVTAPAVTATPDGWPPFEAAAIRRQCKRITELPASWSPIDVCVYGTAAASDLIARGNLDRWENLVTLAYPLGPANSVYGGIKVPSDYYVGEFLPDVKREFGPEDRVCFYSSSEPLQSGVWFLEGSTPDSTGRLIFIRAKIRLCPEGME
jgi:hypothetical protein